MIYTQKWSDLPEETACFGFGGFAQVFFGGLATDGQSKGSIAALTREHDERHDAFEAQQGNFHVIFRGKRGGVDVDRTLCIDRFSRVISAARGWERWQQEVISSPQLKRIISNVAERGYDTHEDLNPPSWPAKKAPKSHAGRLLCAFRQRMELGLPGVPYILGELKTDNAAEFTPIIKALGLEWAKKSRSWANFEDDLWPYIENENPFVASLVDQLVPARFPDNPETSFDGLARIVEPYRLWAIAHQNEDWKICEVPGDIVYTDNHLPYALRKLGLLNLPHILIVMYAIHKRPGWDLRQTYFSQAMKDKQLRKWVEEVYDTEIVPALRDEVEDAEGYTKLILERFDNPLLPSTLFKTGGNGDRSVYEQKIKDRSTFVWELYKQKFNQEPPLLREALSWEKMIPGS